MRPECGCVQLKFKFRLKLLRRSLACKQRHFRKTKFQVGGSRWAGKTFSEHFFFRTFFVGSEKDEMSGRVIELTQVPPQAFFSSFIRSSRGKNDNNAAEMVSESKEIIEERTARLPLFFKNF